MSRDSSAHGAVCAAVSPFRVREARPEDAPALHALYHAAYSVHHDPHRPPLMALRDSVEDVRAYIEEGDVLVAEDAAGRLVASVHARAVVNLRRLAVAPDAKRQGLGAMMLAAGEAHARGAGARWAVLDTLPEHPWLPDFYRAQGYQDRSIETFPDGSRWRQLRKRL